MPAHIYAGGGEHAPAPKTDVFCTLLTVSTQQDLWRALLLSHLGTREAVDAAVESEWAQDWCLLEQLQAHTTEKEHESLALLFVNMFTSNIPKMMTRIITIIAASSASPVLEKR